MAKGESFFCVGDAWATEKGLGAAAPSEDPPAMAKGEFANGPAGGL